VTRDQLGPVQPDERVQLVDVLRAFALWGILQVNFAREPWNDVIEFFAAGSFYPAFSFLFGLGFAIQLIRAAEARRPFVFRYLWRTVILFAIGAAHAMFIWYGDIVHIYAMLAPVLLLVRRWRGGLLLGLVTLTLVLSMGPRVRAARLVTRTNPELVEANRLAAARSYQTALADPPGWCESIPGLTDGYRTHVCNGAVFVRYEVTRAMTSIEFWRNPSGTAGILPMFLLGLYVGRRRILGDVGAHTRLLVSVAGAGLAVGLAGNALALFPEYGLVVPRAIWGYNLIGLPGNIGLSLFYLASVALLFTHARRARTVFAPLAYVGRMGLTNYLVQSLVCAALLGWGAGNSIGLLAGFNAIDRGPDWYRHLLLNGFFVVQIVYSKWWFRRFQFGPVEWAWRSLTWFRWQPMRAPAPAPPTLQPVV